MKEQTLLLNIAPEEGVLPINAIMLERQITGIHESLERLRMSSSDFRASLRQRRNYAVINQMYPFCLLG